LDIVCNVRHDTVLYDLKPIPAGGRGRPASHGRRLSIVDDFIFSGVKVGKYNVAHRKVLTNLLKNHEMEAFVTRLDGSKERRLFLSTVSAERLSMPFVCQQMVLEGSLDEDGIACIPYVLYAFRWKIEVGYYEQKAFWSLCRYMVRSRKGIEMLINLIGIAYSSMKILPYADKFFARYRGMGTQEFRFILSQKIQRQIILVTFVKSAEKAVKSRRAANRLKQWFSNELSAA